VRIGLLDIGAAGVLLVALLLPAPAHPVRPLYNRVQAELAPRIALAQAEVARDPSDAAAAARLADLLVEVRQTDWAVRAAAQGAAAHGPERWRAAVAVSAAHMDRREVGPAYEWADAAIKACDDPSAECPDYERARLDMYATALKAVRESGVDAKKNGKGVAEAVERAVPLIRLGKPR
jgi:hypothetical protein